MPVNYIIGKRIFYHAAEIFRLRASDEEVPDETFSLCEIVPAELITIFPSKVFYLQKLRDLGSSPYKCRDTELLRSVYVMM